MRVSLGISKNRIAEAMKVQPRDIHSMERRTNIGPAEVEKWLIACEDIQEDRQDKLNFYTCKYIVRV